MINSSHLCLRRLNELPKKYDCSLNRIKLKKFKIYSVCMYVPWCCWRDNNLIDL